MSYIILKYLNFFRLSKMGRFHLSAPLRFEMLLKIVCSLVFLKHRGGSRIFFREACSIIVATALKNSKPKEKGFNTLCWLSSKLQSRGRNSAEGEVHPLDSKKQDILYCLSLKQGQELVPGGVHPLQSSPGSAPEALIEQTKSPSYINYPIQPM